MSEISIVELHTRQSVETRTNNEANLPSNTEATEEQEIACNENLLDQKPISDMLQHVPPSSKKPRRVKVYLLQGDDWLDHGTGYCTGEVEAATQKPCFVVRSELDAADVLLRSHLEGSIQYQRQQETLIVWTDLAGTDLALSFQESEGCADLCEFIVHAQQAAWAPQVSLYYVLSAPHHGPNSEPAREFTELVTGPVTYPPTPPTRIALPEIVALLTHACGALFSRGKVLTFLADTHYFDALFDLFAQLENGKDLDGVLAIGDAVRTTLCYNEPRILDELLSLELRALGLAGVLEYDRSAPNVKACHREYLQDTGRTRTVVPLPRPPGLSDMDLFRRDFVLQYFRTVALVQPPDENVLVLLASMAQATQADILAFLQNAKTSNNFLARLLALYETNLDTEQRNDGVRLVHQYVRVAIQLPLRQLAGFFRALVRSGLARLLAYAMHSEKREIRVCGVEILAAMIDHDGNGEPETEEDDSGNGSRDDDIEAKIRPGFSRDSAESLRWSLMKDMSLVLLLAKLLFEDADPALKIQAYEALKSLLCSTVFDMDGQRDMAEVIDIGVSSPAQKYFKDFYVQVAPAVFATFIDLASTDECTALVAERQLQKDPLIFQQLCDLLSFCCQEHVPAVCRLFFTTSSVLDGIVKVLILDVHVTLKLGVLRCFKSLLLLDDAKFCEYMIRNDLFAPFFTFFESVADENSLANSLCLDLLEIVIKRSGFDNYGKLAVHISQNYKLFLDSKITYVSTGQDLLTAARGYEESVKDSTVTCIDLQQENIQDVHPSSPIARDLGLSSLDDVDEATIKRKRGNAEGGSEKKSCLGVRDQFAKTCYEDIVLEEESSQRGMAT